MKQKPNFIISSVSQPSLTSKLDVVAFEALLNEQLQLSDYGTSIEQLVFTFLATSEDAPIKKNEQQIYIEVAKILEISLKLPYKQLIRVKEAEIKELMAALFLKSIALYSDLEIPDFEWQIFYIDTKTLLVKEGWLSPHVSLQKQFLLDFGIGGTDWLVMGKKMSHFYQIERILNRHLQLSDYGIGVNQLQYAFVVLPNASILPDTSTKEYIFARKQVKIAALLEYEKLLEADEYDLLNLLAEYLLKAILKIAELQIADFDWKRLYRHVRWLLIVEEWLDEPLTLQEKTSITGLPTNLIKRIENNVEMVRVGAVKTYCEKLKVPYREVVPELVEG
ncbi:MAG: hypothetical protein AB8B69_04840 [Chitinophagales bacterium]